MNWQDTINGFLDILLQDSLSEREIFLLQNSNLIDEEKPCYLADLLHYLLQYRVSNSLCTTIDNEMLKSIGNSIGCTIKQVDNLNEERADFFIKYYHNNCGC